MSADNLGGGLLFVTAVDDGNDGLSEIQEGHTGHGITKGGGLSTISAVTDALHQGDLGQKGYAKFLS